MYLQPAGKSAMGWFCWSWLNSHVSMTLAGTNGLTWLCSTGSLFPQQSELSLSSWWYQSSERKRGEMLKVSWGLALELVQSHFYHILLTKANPKASLESRDREIDSTIAWKDLQKSHCNQLETGAGRIGIIFCNQSIRISILHVRKLKCNEIK